MKKSGIFFKQCWRIRINIFDLHEQKLVDQNDSRCFIIYTGIYYMIFFNFFIEGFQYFKYKKLERFEKMIRICKILSKLGAVI